MQPDSALEKADIASVLSVDLWARNGRSSAPADPNACASVVRSPKGLHLLARPPREERPLGVFATGLRGIPNVLGGVERHCQSLYPRIVRDGNPVTVFARSGYVPGSSYEYRGVRILPLMAPRTRAVEAFAHTGLAVMRAKSLGAKLLHIHGIGPALWTGFAKRLGMNVVVTHHGFDYNRQKWGARAKMVLRKGEEMAIHHADAIICISNEIRDHMVSGGAKGIVTLIPNGVERPDAAPPSAILDKWNLRPNAYLLLTARFVAEKGIPDLIRAWAASGLKGRCALAVAGGEDHPSPIGEEIRSLAHQEGAVLTGVVQGDELKALYAHARGFVLPSYHEGLPISLLEAMSWDLPVVASSISSNAEVGLPETSYFPAGDLQRLARRLTEIVEGPARTCHAELVRKYDWDVIAKSTEQLYGQVMGHPSLRMAHG